LRRIFWDGRVLAMSLLLCAGLMVGCGGSVAEDPILRLSSEEAFAKGKELMAAEKYELARDHFAHAFQTAPNSEIGRDALLLQADAYFLSGGESNLVRAEAKYRDFNNRYPTSDQGSYVQYQIAHSLELRMRKPDRDQAETQKAISAFEELLTLYPTSEHAAEAEAGIERLKVNLANHEFLVARYQFRRGLHQAAIARLEYLASEFPEYPELDEAICLLGRSHKKLGEAEEAAAAFTRLRVEFPKTEACRDQKGAAA
jgi:outer membrane protein assembly factor BamD